MTATEAPAGKPPHKKMSSREVYSALREMILDFELYPGARVTETELAERFDVSRTPVREALQRLEAEGYLTIRPKQGCFIRPLDIDRLQEIYRVRVALERLSIETACTYMPDRKLKELAAAWEPTRHEGRSADAGAMQARDESFHIALAEGGGNMALVQYLKDINNHIRIIRRLDFTDATRIERTYEEHHRICQHLLRRELAAAQNLMARHISHSEDFAKNLALIQLARKRPRPIAAPNEANIAAQSRKDGVF